MSRTWAIVLRAGAALREGDKKRAEPLLVSADRMAAAATMRATSAAMRYHLGNIREDEDMIVTSVSEMTKLGVRVARKMTALLLPVPPR